MKKLVFTLLLVSTASTTAFASTDTYVLDPNHTNARFAIGHFGTSTNHGGFYNLTGEIRIDNKNQTGAMMIVIPVASINSGNQQFDNHLKHADLFNAEQFPQMTFTSTQWKFVDGKPQTITGNLELLGQTHSVTLNSTRFNCYESPMFDGATVCGGDFEATIDRTRWGMNYMVDAGIPKEVKLSIQVEAVKQ